VSGDPEGVLARLGHGVLLGLALALTPLFCAIVCGGVLVFTRKVQVGRTIELGGQRGRVISVGLLDVLLRDAQGGEVRVPHLSSLLSPLRVLSAEPRASVSVTVSPEVDPAAVIELLASSLGGVDPVLVELSHIDADGARYEVSVPLHDERTPAALRLTLVQALLRERMPLGRSGPGSTAHG
jgi:small-conductance mechanosensitive channel